LKVGKDWLLAVNRNRDMKLTDLIEWHSLKRSKKRDALKKILHKLEKKKKKLEKDLKSADQKKTKKKLVTKLKTNKWHRRKAKKLIAELK
jgi:hypothetical protein